MSNLQIKWKPHGLSGNVAGRIKPFNKTNPYLYNHPFGKPRPIKHYRKGRIPVNDMVKSEVISTDDMMGKPGGFVQNSQSTSCVGVNTVATYYPNSNHKSDRPCCSNEVTKLFNPADKARRRVRSGSSIVKPNYYQRLQEYRSAKCDTFEQKSFHFDELDNPNNQFRGRCANVIFNYDKNGNIVSTKNNCTSVTYNPLNVKYSQDGAVSSSMHTLNNKTNNIARAAKFYANHKKNGQRSNCEIHVIKKHKQNKTICV